MLGRISKFITLALFCTTLPLTSIATELPASSNFTNELDNISFPVTTGPNGPVVIKMDFSQSNIYTYDYGQKVESQQTMGQEQEVPDQKMNGTGKLLLKSQGNQTANLVINDLTLKQTITVGGEEKTMELNSPPLFVPGVKENGKMQAGFNSQNVLFQMLFPLTEKKLKRGDTFKNDLAMPFNLAGSVLPINGKSITKLTEFVLINGEVCARFDTSIEFSDPQIPSEIKAKLETQMNGRSVSFFNIEKGCFQQADIAFLMAFSMSREIPKVEGMEKLPAELMGESMNIEMASDNYISYSLSSISEAEAE